MNVVLDGRYIQDHYPGVGRYAYSLAIHLAPSEGVGRLLVLYDPAAANTRFDMGPLRVNPRVDLIAASCSPLGFGQHLVVPGLVRRHGGTVYLAPHWGAPRGLGCPLVLTVHDLTPWVLRDDAQSGWRRWVYQRLLCGAVRRSAAVVVSSEATRRDLERLIPSSLPVIVAPLGVDPAFYPRSEEIWGPTVARLGVRTPYVLCVSTNRPHKNLDRLLRAWALLPPALRAAWQLVLAGGVDARWQDPAEAAQRMALESSVRRLGHVNEQDLAALYAAAEVCVVPSLYEGFGLSALEAMASGAAVAASRRAALPEVVGESGLLFDPTDVGAIAEALSSLMNDPAIRQRLGAKGRERAAMYTWQRTAALVREALRLAHEGG